MPNSLKARLKKLVYQGILSQEDLDRIIVVPKGATNGDAIKALFPDVKCENEEGYDVETSLCFKKPFSGYWWNKSYTGKAWE